jgi:WD40 repeat protein/tRNA A-37 threonylcarbamoyl transferase component Bud32
MDCGEEPGQATDDRRSQRIDAVMVDVLRRRASGEELSDEAILAAHGDLFPELSDSLRKLRVIHAAQHRARRLLAEDEVSDGAGLLDDFGDTIGPDEAACRRGALEVRCPHCRCSIQLGADASFTDIHCGTCGGVFSLVDQAGDTKPCSSRKTIGHFDLVEPIGTGSFGTVWKARDTKLDRWVAVKLPHRGKFDANQTEMFLREARAAAQLNHPHIVSVHEIGRDQDQLFIVTDFVRGATLSEWISERVTSPREATELCGKFAEALHHAHEAGVVHRDLKPGNIMLDEEGQPHIMDFGLAKRDAGDTTMTVDGRILGTPAYMSPEQAEGRSHHADRRSDVYSLGVILYQLLTGELPFRGSEQMIVLQIVNEEPAGLRKLNRCIPRDLETICLKCLEKEPRRRYQTAAALAEDLRRFLAGESIQARPIRTMGRVWRWSRRHPASATAAALGLALLFLMIAVPVGFQFVQQDHLRKLEGERAEVTKAWESEKRNVALLVLTDAQNTCKAGDVGRGLIRLADGLELARDAKADDLEQVFRWNLGAWSREMHQLQHVIEHPRGVRAVAVSPDGSWIATGCDDAKARFWDLDSAALSDVVLDHPQLVTALAFHPDGHELLTGCRDGRVRRWNVASGELIEPVMIHYRPEDNPPKGWSPGRGISGLAYHPSGQTFASSGYDGFVRVWDAATPSEPVMEVYQSRFLSAIAFNPVGDDNLAASGYAWDIKFWNTRTGRCTKKFAFPGLVEHLDFDPAGERLLVSTMQEHFAQQFDCATTKAIGPRLAHFETVHCAKYSPSGKWIATASADHTARIWDAATGLPVGPPLEHRSEVRTIAFGGDDDMVLSGCSDGGVRVWRRACGSDLHTLKHRAWVRSAAFAPDNESVVTGVSGIPGDLGKVTLWNARTGEVIGPTFSRQGWTQGVAFSPDGKTVYAANHGRQVVRRLNATTGEQVGCTQRLGAKVWRIALSPDGTKLLTSGFENCARLWDTETGQPIGEPLRHSGKVNGLAFSSDGRKVLTGSTDRTTRYWDADTGKPLTERIRHDGQIWAVAFSPDDRMVLTGGSDHNARLWDAETWQPIGLPMEHDARILGVAFSPNGQLALTCGEDQTARMWHVPTGQAVGPSLRHMDAVNTVACSLDGQMAVTASDDKTAKILTLPEPVVGEPDKVRLWVETITGLSSDASGAIYPLSAREWADKAAQRDISSGSVYPVSSRSTRERKGP